MKCPSTSRKYWAISFNLICWSNVIAATLSKSSALCYVSLHDWSIWCLFLFLCFLSVTVYLQTQKVSSQISILIPSNLSLRRMYVEQWIIWYICRSWLSSVEMFRYEWHLLSHDKIGGRGLNWYSLKPTKHSIAVEDPREMRSGICISECGRVLHSEIIRLPKHSVLTLLLSDPGSV